MTSERYVLSDILWKDRTSKNFKFGHLTDGPQIRFAIFVHLMTTSNRCVDCDWGINQQLHLLAWVNSKTPDDLGLVIGVHYTNKHRTSSHPDRPVLKLNTSLSAESGELAYNVCPLKYVANTPWTKLAGLLRKLNPGCANYVPLTGAVPMSKIQGIIIFAMRLCPYIPPISILHIEP